MTEANVVVLGAGVIGLTTALLLSKDAKTKVTVVAKHMPGDYDAGYASPWAGANYAPVSSPGTLTETLERDTWPELQRLASEQPEAGIHFQEMIEFFREKDLNTVTGQWTKEKTSSNPWFAKVVPNFRSVPKTELPSGMDRATTFKSVCINTAIYLPWLASQCLRHGVILRRASVDHVTDAASLHHSAMRADVVVNCVGLAASKLGGVADKNVIPARGQTVLVRNEPGMMYGISGTDDGSDEVSYIMQRAAGGGTILGGCYQKNNWDSQVDPNLAVRIMRRCLDLCPQLTGGRGIEALDVIRHNVGLRPLREEGPRVEREKIDDVWVVHQYGHGGYGYQASYGSAYEALKLVEEAIGLKEVAARL